MNSNRGGAAGFGKREFYTALALALSLLAFLLFVSPAWAQVTIDKDAEPNPVEVGDFLLYTVTVTNTDTINPQTVVVRDNLPNNVRFEAVAVNGGLEDECEETNNEDREVVCEVTLEPDENPETTDDDEATIQILVEPETPGDITNIAEVFEADTTSDEPFDVNGARIDRATVDTDVINDRNLDPDPFPPGFFDGPNDFFGDPDDFVDEDNDNIPDIFDEDIDDSDEDEDQNEEDLVDAEQYVENGETTDGEGTDGDNGQYDDDGNSGVSATADENGAEASTPGASASAGGDPDEQAPVSGEQGDVVDEVPTSGPLPNTGGVPVAAGTVVALVLFGAGLLVVRLVMIWRERRA